MKNVKKTPVKLLLLFFGIAYFLISCQRESSKEPLDGNGLSTKINQIIADSIIKNMESRGMVINRGNTPPNIEGIYLASPVKLISPYGPEDSFENGEIVTDYLYHILDQKGDEAKMNHKNTGTDVAEGESVLISGSGNKFTLFSESKGVSTGVPYTTVSILTGEKTTEGIKNFQYGFVLTRKEGDESDIILMPEGKSRIYEDADKLAQAQDRYGFKTNKENKTRGNLSSMQSSR